LLRFLYTDEAARYLVVIISNQGGISLKSDPKTIKSDQRRLSQFKEKVTLVFNRLDFPMSLYAATARDRYRKPRTGIWKELVDDYDLDVDNGLDLQSSIFVGDAGGRSARNGVKADHASSDRLVILCVIINVRA
jgi:bifunctional polynucleotide phosphatase/kinase